MNLKRIKVRPLVAFTLILSLVLSLVAPLLHPSTAEAAWAGTFGNWAKRKELTITNNSTTTNLSANTTVAISIDTKALYDAGQLQSDCDDLRVVYQPDSTTYTELTRYLVYPSGTTCSTSGATKVYFSLQASLAFGISTTYYYMYYDNPQAATPASTDNAFDVGASDATLVCPFNGTTTCAAGETATSSGAIRYSGSKSALSFDGANDYVSVPDNVMTSADNYTIEFWMKASTFINMSGTIRPFYFVDGGANQNYLSVSSGGAFYTSNLGGATLTGTLTANTWTHFAVSKNSTTIYAFVNGTLVDSDVSTGTLTIASSFHIGNQQTSLVFPGIIDEFRVSNTTRYTTNFTPTTTPFVRDSYTKLLYHFDESGVDPRGSTQTLDDSGNNKHGTITGGATYVTGLVGVDASSTDTGYQSSQSFAGHEGVFIEEGTTNKITNPSYEHATYGTNWSASDGTENYDNTRDTFTASMAKRNSAGPFAAGPMVQGKLDGTGTSDKLTAPRGDVISGNFWQNFDYYQGSIVMWVTPEWNGNDGLYHTLLDDGAYVRLRKGSDNKLYCRQSDGVDISGWTAGSTYSIVCRWDIRNTLDGTNYVSLSIDDTHYFSRTSPPTDWWNAFADGIYIGSQYDGNVLSANTIIEGLTIYRRPLWDGSYGINAGNGDEINLISGASDQDPTLVTGSWDVVFALPTNATAGALSTGTGEAWTHPHASNLMPGNSNKGGFMMDGTYTNDGYADEGSPASVSALAAGEKIYAGGYKVTSDAANEGIYDEIAVTSGNDYVIRAVAHSDGTSIPKVVITGADDVAITSLTGTATSTRTAPDVLLFTFEADATENIKVKLINSDATAAHITYWHQIEVLANLVNNPSAETGSGDPWIPTGWSNTGLSTGESTQDASTKHSGSSSVYLDPTITDWSWHGISHSTFTPAVGSFYSFGYWGNKVSGSNSVAVGTNGRTAAQYSLSSYISISNSSANKMYYGVERGLAALASGHIIYGNSTYAINIDDVYEFALTAVSLTVTPASEANSLESSGLRVDGGDSLTQTINNLSLTSGQIRFKWTPRHSAGTVTSYGIAQPLVAFFYNSTGPNYIKIGWSTASNLRAWIYTSGAKYGTEWNATGSIIAGTTYTLDFSYGASGFTLKVDGTARSTYTDAAVSFSAVPSTAYWGSDNSSGAQVDGTIAAATVTSVTPAENTTAPYYKFGSKSVKLDASAVDASNYLISIGAAATTHTLSAYVYNGTSGSVGSTVDGSVATLVFKGSVVTTTYTDMGGGWWRLTYAGTSQVAAANYGVHVQTGKIVYVDGVQLEALAYVTTYTDGTLGTGYAWTGTANDSTSTRTATTASYPVTNNFTQNSFTISTWVKPVSAASTTLRTFVGPESAKYGPLLAFKVQAGCSNNYRFSISDNGVNIASECNTAITLGNWYHLVGTWDGSTLKLYVNGTIGANTAAAFTQSSPTTLLTVGYDASGNGGPSDSVVSDFRIFSTALTQTQVTDLYTSGLVGHSETSYAVERFSSTKGQDPVAIYHFDEGQGTTAHDSSTYKNNGTISGATWIQSGQCVSGKCLQFDGSNDVVTVSSSSSLGTVSSLGFWIKPISTTFSALDLDGGTHYISAASGVLSATGFSTPTIYVDGVATTTIVANRWQYVEVTTATSFAASAITIGKVSSTYFNGFIDELKLYPYARSASQVKADFNGSYTARIASNSEALSEGLVGYWKMDETATPSVDSSGNGYSGTWVGGTTYTAGKFNNAGSFDGDGDYVNLGIPNIGTTSHTTSIWIYPNAFAARGIVEEITGSFATQKYALDISNSGKLSGVLTIGGTKYTTPDSTIGLTLSTWNHVAMVYNGSNITVYVNGANSGATIAATGSMDALTHYLALMRRTDGTCLNGKADELRFYNRALSPAEVRQLYDWAPGPVAHWSMDEKAGQYAYDTSGSGNTGTLGANASVGSDDPTWANGKYGGGLTFDGSDDYVLTTSDIDVYGGFTVEAWFKYTNCESGATDWCYILNKAGSAAASPYILFVSTNRVSFETGGVELANTTNVNDGKWHHVTGVINSTAISLYVDGILVDSDTATPVNDNNVIKIGGYTDTSNRYFEGSIDDVRIYNYARTAKQIVSDMNASHPAVGSPVGSALAYYKFDEGADNTCKGGTNDTCNSGSGGSTYDGAVTGATRTNNGKYGKALSFDGSDDYVATGDMSAAETKNFSYSLWFKTSDTSGNQAIFSEGNSANNVPAVYIGTHSSSTTKLFVFFRDDSSGGGSSSAGTTTVTDNTWHHVVLSSNGSTYTLFVDGKVDVAATSVPSGTVTLNLSTIGGLRRTGGIENPIAAIIDEVKIYTYALTEDEVRTDYNHGAAMAVGSQAPQDSSSTPSNLTNGLVGYWKMDETSTPSVDSSGNGNSGTWYNHTTYAAGKFNNATSFDGTDDYITVTANATLNNSSFSVGAWVNPSALQLQGFFSKISYASSWRLFMISSSGKIEFDGISDSYNLQSNTAISASQWSHIFATFDANTKEMKIYINGIPDKSLIISGDLGGAYNNAVSIGSLGGTSTPYNGKIDEARAYNRALTPQEVENLYNWAPGPMAEWKMDEKIGQTVYDSSGNANNATLGADTSVGSDDPTWVSGKSGGALQFDGSTDFVYLPYSNPGTSITYSILFKTQSTSNQNLISYGATLIRIVPSSNIIYWFPDVNYGAVSATATVNKNTWYHLAVTQTGLSYVIYLNGSVVGSGSASYAVNPTNLYRYLGRYASTIDFNGTIDTVKIYKYARSAAQIAYDYNGGDPVAWYKMDECTGSTIHNSSNTSYNGTWYGTGGGTQTSVGDCNTSGTAWGAGASGKYGASLNFDGTDDYVDIGTGPTTVYSVSFWVKPTTTTEYPVDLNGSAYVYLNAGTVTATGFTSPTIYINGVAKSSPTVSASTWSHVTVTTATAISATDFDIGRIEGVGYQEGQLDDVRIYNYPLSPTQVKMLYNADSAARF